MTIKELKEYIKDSPDDMLVVVPSSDHSYRAAYPSKCKAIIYPDDYISEDFKEDDPESKRIDVLVMQ